MRTRIPIWKRLLATVGVCLLGLNLPAQQTLQMQQPVPPPPTKKPSDQGFRMRGTTEIVLVNVIARDKKGNLLRDLKQSDFTLYEDGQKQQIASFDFENVDEFTTPG